MKTLLHPALLTFLLAFATVPCFAMMGIEEVTRERAKELGMEIRTTGAGPDAVRVELEFETKGDLKSYSRVDFELTEGGKLSVFTTLKEEKSKPGHILVSFAAAPSQLDKITLRVVTGDYTDRIGHDLRMKNFVDLRIAASTAAPEEQTRFLTTVRKAFEARDASTLTAMTFWDRVPEKQKKNTVSMYENLVAEKNVLIDFTLVDPDRDAVARHGDRIEDGVTYRFNLPITKELSLKYAHPTDKRTLMVLTFAVGEKDGKLVLLGSAPVK